MKIKNAILLRANEDFTGFGDVVTKKALKEAEKEFKKKKGFLPSLRRQMDMPRVF